MYNDISVNLVQGNTTKFKVENKKYITYSLTELEDGADCSLSEMDNCTECPITNICSKNTDITLEERINVIDFFFPNLQKTNPEYFI